MKKILATLLIVSSPVVFAQETTVINGLDFGPLASLVGTWKTAETGGVDVAPAQEGMPAGKGNPSMEPFYEVMTFEPAADAKNASNQYLVAMYYKLEVFRKRDNVKFHDQRGYLTYDKGNQKIYNTYCIPRAVCVVAEGKAGNKIEFKLPTRGIAESQYMTKNDTTKNFSMTLDISQKDILKYSQTTSVHVYGKDFSHTDFSTLKHVK